MSDDRFDVLERFERLVQAPEPSFEGFLRRRDRKRRNQRIAAGVVAIAIFAAPVAWIATNGRPSDRTETPGANGPTVAPDDADRVGLIGLPPEGATPSTPSRGELLFGGGFGHTGGDPGQSHVYVYADGRLIWYRWDGYPALLERRLTPEGVELVMAEVIATGLFDHDLHLLSAPGLYFGAIEFRNEDRLVHVTWDSSTSPEGVTEEIPTPEQVSALQRLDARLADPASWLPASAWVDPENKAYVPSRYEVCYNTAQPGIELSRVWASFPQPAEDLLRTWDRTHNEMVDMTGVVHGDAWCSDVATEEVRALARILEDAGTQENGQLLGTHMFGYVVRSKDPADGTYVRVVIAPLLPHQG
jgi:hypothetical protein